MPNQHKRPPLAFRPPEDERLWLLAYQERTGKPMNAILTEAVRLFREAADRQEAPAPEDA
jgi:hypothetical protein